jgi:osmotically-inducible protein OsmY
MHAETRLMGVYVPPVVDNAVLTTRVQHALSKDTLTSALKINWQAQNGIIYINGTLATAEQAINLVQRIASVEGVVDVNTDQLNITENNTSLSLYDVLLTARVKGMLARQHIFGNKDAAHLPIDIYTHLGIVYLRGMVDSPQQLIDTVRLVQSIKSVPRVISMLVIRGGTVYTN